MFQGGEAVKKALIIILFVLSILNITSCNRKTEEIVVGLNYEGSGTLAPYGKAILWGAELAVEEINASGGIDGHTVRLEKADNRSIGAESASAVLYLKSVKDADVIIGPATSTLAKAALSADADVLIISPSATADELTKNNVGASIALPQMPYTISVKDSSTEPVGASIALPQIPSTISVKYSSTEPVGASITLPRIPSTISVKDSSTEPVGASIALPQIPYTISVKDSSTKPVGESITLPQIPSTISVKAGGVVNPSQTTTSFLRLCFSDSVQGSAMGEYANEQGFKRSAILVDMSSDYSVGCAAAFRSAFSGEIVFEGRFFSGDTDFSALVTELSKTDFDCVYLPAYYTEAGLIIRQSREQGIKATFLGGDAMDSPYLADVIGKPEYLYGITYTDHFSYDEPIYKTFAQKFLDRYGENPPAYSALAYDSVMLYCETLRKVGVENIQSVENILFNTDSFQGVTGKIKIKENGDCEKEPVFVSLFE